ncbi:hypothetical protein D3C81_982280 [compost metagenome]
MTAWSAYSDIPRAVPAMHNHQADRARAVYSCREAVAAGSEDRRAEESLGQDMRQKAVTTY